MASLNCGKHIKCQQQSSLRCLIRQPSDSFLTREKGKGVKQTGLLLVQFSEA